MKWWLSVCDGMDQYRAYTFTGTDDRTAYPRTDENGWFRAYAPDDDGEDRFMYVQKRFVVCMYPAEADE
jgi:hypothetical protein